MKKNILLIFVFITLFFVGNNDVFAKKCEVGDECLTEVKEYIGNGTLACLYEVEIDEKKYYSYIYYQKVSDGSYQFYGNSSYFSGNSVSSQILRTDDNTWIMQEEYDDLVNNNKCPQYSYLENNGSTKELCFDSANGNEGCKNNGEKLNSGTNFNDTTGKGKLIENNLTQSPGEQEESDITFGNACDENKIPSGYKVCKYRNQEDSSYAILYYNNNTNKIFYKDSERSFWIDKNQSKNFTSGRINNGCTDSGMCYYSTTKYTYENNITGQITSCPERIHLNYYGEDQSGNYLDKIYTKDYKFELDRLNNSYQIYKYYSCEDGNNVGGGNVNGCSDLIDGELREIINSIMKLLRIAIIILLLGLLTFDFVSAVFANDDKKMNEAKNKVIKRIIIAIVIFFVPTLLNFVFDIVNEVWGTNFSTCNIEETE